ncbi:DNA helicase [Erwinia phage Cronus]|uniref:DNA helicase n=1 Tax=Erwinia phage Cronus TaxID=2163633 RepID=A0A2S1GLX4_9CAUD|nr:DNA helicase [Erwinia phage Cronus]AWD90343.1 DNA helicase [Erwinia phage Cronus]
MKNFEEFLYEADIQDFMGKVTSCQTKEGLKELEKYYTKRSKEAELKDTDDITLRDALAGRKAELEAADAEEDEESF